MRYTLNDAHKANIGQKSPTLRVDARSGERVRAETPEEATMHLRPNSWRWQRRLLASVGLIGLCLAGDAQQTRPTRKSVTVEYIEARVCTPPPTLFEVNRCLPPRHRVLRAEGKAGESLIVWRVYLRDGKEIRRVKVREEVRAAAATHLRNRRAWAHRRAWRRRTQHGVPHNEGSANARQRVHAVPKRAAAQAQDAQLQGCLRATG